ncbi:MAG: hypothetical protein GXX91_09525 [Verrucomicrobiaceae bacterium]|nr:hypothetical protein [Verrucomicrobiaceae bacterium]
MTTKTELLLYRLLWLAEKPVRPTFRNLELGFEGWAYREGLLKQVSRLEARGLLEARIDPATGQRLHRLTETGRRIASGGRAPESAWSRKWDKKWRLFLFDIPESERSKRQQLTRTLSRAGCGCLQGSVWIAPFLPPAFDHHLAESDPDCSQLLTLLADSKGRETDSRMVKTAWDFDRINHLYDEVAAVLDRFESEARGGTKEDLEQWTAEESAAWKTVIAVDPLLPAELLPKTYAGRRTWRRRKSILAEAALLAADFAPDN